MTDIYFACSIRGGRADAEHYAKLVDHIKTRAVVLSEIFADGMLTAAGSPGPSAAIHDQDMEWVNRADGVIAEVTSPSLGVGYEIAKAESLGTAVLALFRDDDPDRKLSAMIDGAEGVEVVRYREIDEAYLAIDRFVEILDQREPMELRQAPFAG